MLPSLGFQEILLLGVLALVVVGPKDLPLMLRKLGRFTARMRALANEFRTGMDELARQAELDELRKEVQALRRDNPLRDIGAPLRDIEREIARPVDVDRPAGALPAPAPDLVEAPPAEIKPPASPAGLVP